MIKIPLLVAPLLLGAILTGQESGLDKQAVGAFRWQPIGPANMSGRITDLAVLESDPSRFWVATASGGLLKTENAGDTFEHQFDDQTTVSIGAVAVSQTNPDLLWIGTGEENPRNSVSYGDGVYKSTDGGDTWTNMGLEASFQIGCIRIHPKNDDVVYVGALGRLYGPSEERGLYKTTDGGKTWSRILYVDDKTGVMDIAMHPEDPETMLVATYERQRDGFDTNDPAKKIAPGSGIHRTTDGGKTFTKVSEGLPTCELGRVAFDWYRKDPNVVYAMVESAKIGMAGEGLGWSGISANDAETGARVRSVQDDSPAAKAGLKEGDIILAVDGFTVLSGQKFNEAMVKTTVGQTVDLEVARDGESMAMSIELVERPEGGNQRPYGTRLGGQNANIHEMQGPNGHEHGGLYRSADGGVSWARINSINPRPMYFSHFRVDPSDENHQFVLGVSMSRSSDRGAKFTSDAGRGVHSDQHALWINPNNGRHMILGSDGGLYISNDRANNWRHLNHVAIGQFYHVAVGPRRDYWVYGGLQDNGTWGAPRRGRHGGGTINEDWVRVGGGDGFLVQVDSEDPNQIYYESQNGGMGRTHLVTRQGGRIRPRAPRGTSYRFNWRTPFLLSAHNSRIYYCAGNHVFRSLQKGDDLKAISPDISLTERGSATALAESSRDPDVLYVGTDDGALWMTKDGGTNWSNLLQWPEEGGEEIGIGEAAAEGEATATEAVAKKDEGGGRLLRDLIEKPMWVSGIEASRYDDSRVYLTLDGHRSDSDAPHVFVSQDYGATWKRIDNGLPRGSTRCIREDIEDENLLYLGTEFGLYVSIDRGAHWTRFHNNLPTVSIHEVAQHGPSGEIVLGTHGRSLWVIDATPLRQMSKAVAEGTYLLEPNEVVQWRSKPSRGSSGGVSRFSGRNPGTNAEIFYRLDKAAKSVTIEVHEADGTIFRTIDGKTEAGLHRVDWDLRGTPRTASAKEIEDMVRRYGERARRWAMRSRAPSADVGTYKVVLIVDGERFEQSISIETDPNFPPESAEQKQAREFREWEESRGEEAYEQDR